MIAITVALTIFTLAACAPAASSSPPAQAAGAVVSAPMVLEEITGEITVSAFEAVTYGSFLEEAARAFELKYPGTTVNVEIFSAMPEIRRRETGDGRVMAVMGMEDDTAARNDYIQAINTELMSGRGPDILAMDILPLYKYIERGVLTDLRPFMEADANFNSSDFRENILAASMIDERLYMLPMDFMFNFYTYDSYLLPGLSSRLTDIRVSTEELIELGSEVFEEVNDRLDAHAYMFNLNGGRQRPSMFQTMFDQNFTNFVDIRGRSANFNDGTFAEFLEDIQSYVEKGYIRAGAQDFAQIAGGGPEMLERMREERFFFKPKNILNLVSSFYQNPNAPMLMRGVALGNEEDDVIAGIASNPFGETPFTYTQAYAINANSDNQATAWAFISFLASYEMQTSMNLRGLPVHNEAFNQRLERDLLRQMGLSSLDSQGQSILADFKATVNEMAAAINIFFIQDNAITQIIDAELEHFFDGSRSALDVAANIQNRVNLYLNE